MRQRPKIVYRWRYNLGLPVLEKLHRFDIRKYARAVRILLNGGALRRSEIIRPAWPTDSLLRRVHTADYLASVQSPATLAKIVEVPFVSKLPSLFARHALLNPMRWAVGGTILAAELALQTGLAVNVGGGFHHAHTNRGHGFCVYSDIAVAIATLRVKQLAQRFMIIDLDAHQGDGLERIFMNDPNVQIYDMYNADIFPSDEAARSGITWETRLECGTTDQQYLRELIDMLPTAIDDARPDLAFYLAGTDIVRGDDLGLLDISPDGVFRRDQFVLQQLNERGIPAVMVTAGGYTAASAQLIARTVEFLLNSR
jgi:histone deacetylase 11